MPSALYFDSPKGKQSYGEDGRSRAWPNRRITVVCAPPGWPAVKPEALPAVVALARDGGRLVGAATEDDVYRLVADLHS